MRSRSLAIGVVFGVVFVASVVAAPQSSAPAREMLANGFEIVSLVAPADSERIFGVLYVRCGRLDELPGQEGAAQLLASTWIAGGSESESGDALQAWLAEHEAALEATALTDHFSIDFQCRPNDLGTLYAKLGALIAKPRLPETTVAEAREALAVEVADDVDEREPFRALERLALGPTTRAGRIATRASVLSIDRDELAFFQRVYFQADRMLLGVTGRVDAAVLATTREFANALPAVETGHRNLGTVILAPERTTAFVAAGKSPHLWLVAPAPNANEADFALFAWALRRPSTTLRDGPQVGVSASDWLYSSVRVDADLHPEHAATELVALAQNLGQERFAAGFELANAAANQRTNVGREAPTPRRAIELALQDAIRAPTATKLALQPKAEDLAALAERWIDPARVFALATGPVDVLVRELQPRCDVFVLDPTWTVASTPAGRAEEARLFAALGGRARWAALKSLTTDGAAVLKSGERVATRQARDLVGARLWQEQTRGTSVDVTVLDPSGVTIFRGGNAQQQPGEVHARLVRRSACHLFQLLHDLALENGRGVRVASDGMLEVHTPDGVLCWIELDAAGRPKRLGWPADESGEGGLFVYGDWREFGGFPYPATIEQPETGVRTTTANLVVDGPLDEALFRRAK